MSVAEALASTRLPKLSSNSALNIRKDIINPLTSSGYYKYRLL
jgi:hypothetical protein